MKKRGLCLALALMLVLICTSCSSSSVKAKAEKPSVSASQETEAPAKEKEFETEDGLLCITADESWSKAGDELEIEDASLVLSKKGGARMALISEYQWNFPIELAEYNRMVLRQMKDHISGDEAGETEAISLGEYEAFRTDITGSVEGAKQAYRIYCIHAGEYYVQLICWCPKDRQKAFSPEFNRIAKTLLLTEEKGETAE